MWRGSFFYCVWLWSSIAEVVDERSWAERVRDLPFAVPILLSQATWCGR